MGEVERLAHHVLMLRKGRLVDQGSPDELLARYGRDDLEDVFLDIARDRRAARCEPHGPCRRRCAASGACSTAMPTCCWARGRASWTSSTGRPSRWSCGASSRCFLVGKSGWVASAAGVFLSAVLLWDTLFRGQLGVSLCFLEEMYARHLGHLFVSPLRPGELVVAKFLVSLMRVLIGVGGAAILAMPIFHFSLIGSLGWAILPFFAVMMLFGWAIGLIIAGLVRPPGPGGREPGLGRDLLHPALLGRLLPGRHPAALGPLDRVPAALGPGVRGHAGGAGREPLRLGPVRPGRGGAAGLAGGRRHRLHYIVPQCATAGAAAAERRVADRVAAGAMAGSASVPSQTFPTALLFAAVLLSSPPARATGGPLSLESKIPLGAVQGRIDHLAVDLARQRLFVAELGNGSLGVVDLAQGKVVHRIDGLKEPQGVAYAPDADTVYVASAGDGTLEALRRHGPVLPWRHRARR